MRRRNFVTGLVGTAAIIPAVPLSGQQPPAQTQTPAAANPQPPREPPKPPGSPEKLALVPVDGAAQTTQLFFKPDQFAALERLGDLLMPPLKGKPGATDAGAALFLDFLIKESPKDRQQLYRHGLDGLNSSARKHFSRSFSELDASQADNIVKPLLVVRDWPEEMPEDPMQHFISQAHLDFHTATVNSREWAESSTNPSATGRRGFNQAVGLYWHPIDPVVKG